MPNSVMLFSDSDKDIEVSKQIYLTFEHYLLLQNKKALPLYELMLQLTLCTTKDQEGSSHHRLSD